MGECSYKDLTVYGTSNQECLVTKDFEIGELLSDTGLENIESVECTNCGEAFMGLEDAREHIDESDEEEPDEYE